MFVDCVKKTDISKLRGKEAAEALRKKKQEKLDEQKKILDRKLQARLVYLLFLIVILIFFFN